MVVISAPAHLPRLPVAHERAGNIAARHGAQPREVALIVLAEVDIGSARAPRSGGLLQHQVQRDAFHVLDVHLIGLQVPPERVRADLHVATLLGKRAVGLVEEREIVDLVPIGELNVGVEERVQTLLGASDYGVGGKVQVDLRAVVEVGVKVPPLNPSWLRAVALAVLPGGHDLLVYAHALEVLRLVSHSRVRHDAFLSLELPHVSKVAVLSHICRPIKPNEPYR